MGKETFLTQHSHSVRGFPLIRETESISHKSHQLRETPCCSLFSVTVTKAMAKSNSGRKGVISSYAKASTESDPMEDCCFLACFLAPSEAPVQLPFLNSPGPLVEGWYHPQWSRPSYINQQLRKCLPWACHRPIKWR